MSSSTSSLVTYLWETQELSIYLCVHPPSIQLGRDSIGFLALLVFGNTVFSVRAVSVTKIGNAIDFMGFTTV